MKQISALNSEDRAFFGLVAQAAFVNPFSEERVRLDEAIVGHPVDISSTAHVEELYAVVMQRLQGLEVSGARQPRHFTGADYEIMRVVFLFEVYHRYCLAFDRHILEQVQHGDTPRKAPFVLEVLESMRQRGFGPEEALRYAAIFFQLRRAFYFIDQGLIGTSRCMRQLRRHLWNNVFTCNIQWYDQFYWNRMEDFSTLLLGETGTGKGIAAAAIGRSGFIPFLPAKQEFASSFTRGFVALNLSQFPESLIESELFGHRKGAFTGAVESHEGIFSRCSTHGAIFLDEIGDVSVPLQIKLLQVLQDRTFSPVGSHDKRRFNGRVIAATNQPLTELRRQKLFRDDFYYRLCSDSISVPPLRQRLQEDPGELDLLLDHTVLRLTGHPSSEITAMIRQILQENLGDHYPWPGNVRELEQAVRRILLTRQYSGDAISPSRDPQAALVNGLETGRLTADQLLAGYCHLLFDQSQSYEEVARRTDLDYRTVKKYLAIKPL